MNCGEGLLFKLKEREEKEAPGFTAGSWRGEEKRGRVASVSGKSEFRGQQKCQLGEQAGYCTFLELAYSATDICSSISVCSLYHLVGFY